MERNDVINSLVPVINKHFAEAKANKPAAPIFRKQLADSINFDMTKPDQCAELTECIKEAVKLIPGTSTVEDGTSFSVIKA